MRLPARVAGIQKPIHTPKHLVCTQFYWGYACRGSKIDSYPKTLTYYVHNAIEGMRGMRGMHL